MQCGRLVLASVFLLGLLFPPHAGGALGLPLSAAPSAMPAQFLTILREAREARRRKRDRKAERKALAAFLLAGGARTIAPHPCMEHSGINPLYLLPTYHTAFRKLAGGHRNLIVGDSTAAVSALVPGFQSSWTRSVGVPGNRLCHMLITLAHSAPEGEPEAVVVMTLGGNDLLAGLPIKTIAEDARALREALRRQYPNARLVAVGVHPVRLGGERNLSIVKSNQSTRAVWLEDGSSCFVDPKDLFGRDATGQPDASLFLPNDAIHYGGAIALALRELISEQCAVQL